VAEVGSTACTEVLCALDQELAVGLVFDLVGRNRCVKAGPTGSAVVLGVAGEQDLIADDTMVLTIIFVVMVRIRVRPFRASLLGDVVLLFREALLELLSFSLPYSKQPCCLVRSFQTNGFSKS